MKISGIYKIESYLKPERIYIGSTSDINKRWYNHLQELKRNKHENLKLQNHFNKYGESDLRFSILLGCDKENLIKTEQYFIDSYNPYFNICKKAGATAGKDRSLSTKQKLSISHKGINTWMKGHVFTEEHKKKISNAKKGKPAKNKGVKMSLETRMKMSKAQMGNKNSAGNIGEKNSFFGKHHTEEAKEKNRLAHLGKRASEEARKKMSQTRMGKKNHFFGKKHSEETKKLIGNKNRKHKIVA